MADMQMTVSNSSYDHDKFDVSITGLKHSDARQLVDIGNKLILGEPVAISLLPEGSDLTDSQQRALVKVAQPFYERDQNLIMTIKFIRELSHLDLKSAKNLVDNAIARSVAPEWMKSAA